MENLEVKGVTNLLGNEIPNVVGGFGENKKSITDKHIAELHNMKVKHIREHIKNHSNRFKEDVDYIDLKIVAYQTSDNNLEVVGITDYNLELLLSLGYSKMEIVKSNNIYLFSERGYSKLIKILDTDLAWEIHDKLIDEYFTMRELINSKQQLIANTFYQSIFAPTQEERTLNTKLFGELKEEYGREEQKKLDEQLLIQERTENFLSTVDLIKNLEMKNVSSKCLFLTLENLGYGVNELVNTNSKFIHNEKFENDFIRKGLCRCSATNRYTWNVAMINYIKDTREFTDLMKYHSIIISQEAEKKKIRSQNFGFTIEEVRKIYNEEQKENLTRTQFYNFLYKIKWIEKDRKVTTYAKDNSYMYMYYKVPKITDLGLEELLKKY